jgi:hypothetical protein
MILGALLSFSLGTLYEICGTYWVSYSVRRLPVRAALASMACAAAQVGGVLACVARPVNAPFFCVGYGLGTYIAVRLQNRSP